MGSRQMEGGINLVSGQPQDLETSSQLPNRDPIPMASGFGFDLGRFSDAVAVMIEVVVQPSDRVNVAVSRHAARKRRKWSRRVKRKNITRNNQQPVGGLDKLNHSTNPRTSESMPQGERRSFASMAAGVPDLTTLPEQVVEGDPLDGDTNSDKEDDNRSRMSNPDQLQLDVQNILEVGNSIATTTMDSIRVNEVSLERANVVTTSPTDATIGVKQDRLGSSTSASHETISREDGRVTIHYDVQMVDETLASQGGFTEVGKIKDLAQTVGNKSKKSEAQASRVTRQSRKLTK
ncbi:hypothetical protein NE237_028328 [Protea cynaroides]|uniref:Uncharacterized protein n=1 Tax=Protea cynaroides TaxID=273540 RepID=A0A9Q0JTR5_9MAGN|nr:hypothetical protein NE237_028328 [Protea cynaroides]